MIQSFSLSVLFLTAFVSRILTAAYNLSLSVSTILSVALRNLAARSLDVNLDFSRFYGIRLGFLLVRVKFGNLFVKAKNYGLC